MNITPLPAAPDPYNDTTEEFNNKAVAFVAAQQAMVPELNSKLSDFAANLTTLAAGGGFSLSYNVDTSTTAVSDPGTGIMRFGNTSQSSATTLILDDVAGGVSVSSVIDAFASSTSSTKGQLRIQQLNDVTRWAVYNVTAVTSNGGYHTVTVVPVQSSTVSPFLNGVSVVLFFQMKGDKGDIGPQGQGYQNMLVLRTTQTWTPPAGITKARITVINGGDSGSTSNNGTGNYNQGGKGGDWSISVRAVSTSTTYTATVGSGGAAATPASPAGKPGGASSFSGTGITTLTSSNGDITALGSSPPIRLTSTSIGGGGGSLYAPNTDTQVSGVAIGQGGAGGVDGSNSYAGAAGAVIIEY